uniref:3-oxo-5-alpha-steroid 4-dehydrogenase C-terminal domain-containing protein n=1 Tax=Oryza nivara TaxID=4536 RepID=A0A0E0I106_ORYNI
MESEGWPALQPLLCFAWIAATLPIIAAALPIPTAVGGHLLRRLLSAFSSRGKTVRPSPASSSGSSSSKAKFTVPQKYFMHFYVVGVLATTILLLAIWFYAYMKLTPLLLESSSYSTIFSHLVGSNSFSFGRVRSRTMGHKYRVWRTVFALLLMEVQVLRRLYETEHVFHYSPARMHIVGYLTAAPLSLASSCIPEAAEYFQGQVPEFVVKGRARMPDLVIDSSSLLQPLLKLGWTQWIGAVIFIWGSLHQIRCHAILGSLREHKDSDEYITNLSFAAVETYNWYLQKFEDYPRSRYAIIPFVC